MSRRIHLAMPAWRLPACALACAVLSSCAAFAPESPPSHLVDREGIDIVSTAGGRQLVYIKDKGVRERFCYGPGVDLALTQSSSTELGVPMPHGSTGVGRASGTGAMDLGGRSPAVLITREILYRACELTLNIEADGPTTLAIYGRLLGSLERIIASQQGSGAAAASVAPTIAPPATPAPASSSATSSSGSIWGDSSDPSTWTTPPSPAPSPAPSPSPTPKPKPDKK